MEIGSFLLMRQELMLLVITLLLIVAEIAISKEKKSSLVHLVVFLFGIHTLVGFYGYEEGILFLSLIHI